MVNVQDAIRLARLARRTCARDEGFGDAYDALYREAEQFLINAGLDPDEPEEDQDD